MELLHLIGTLLKRIPKSHHLSFGFERLHERSADNQRVLYSTILFQLETHRNIRSLTFLETITPTPSFLVRLMACLASNLPDLETLTVARWGCYLPHYSSFLDGGVFGEAEPPKCLKRVRILYGPSMPLEFLAWPLRPKTDRTAQIKELNLVSSVHEIIGDDRTPNRDNTYWDHTCDC